jgi:hypothetical protein
MANSENGGRPRVWAGRTVEECWTTVRSVADVWALAAGCAGVRAAAPAPPPPSPQIWHRPKCA